MMMYDVIYDVMMYGIIHGVLSEMMMYVVIYGRFLW